MTPKLHAPDGGIFNAPLCEGPTGDVTLQEQGVTCQDCLDMLDEAGDGMALRLRSRGFRFACDR